jgi:16S rRNA C1402 N4-methylase RsmH
VRLPHRKPIMAEAAEVADNPRSRSALLRAAEKL